MICPSFRALITGALLGAPLAAPLAAQWPEADAIPEDITANETLHEVVKFKVKGSSPTATKDCVLVPFISVMNVPKYWEIFAQSVLPSVRFHSESNANNAWTNQLTGVTASAPHDPNRPVRMPPAVAQRAIDEIIWNSIGGFSRPIAGLSPASNWPNDNWPSTGGSTMLWSSYRSTIGTGTEYFDREGFIRQIVVNQHHATTGNTIELESTEVNTIVTMIKEDIAEFELTVVLIEIQDAPHGTTPADLKISLSSTVTLELAPEGEIDEFFFRYDPNDWENLQENTTPYPYIWTIVRGMSYTFEGVGYPLAGQVPKFAITKPGGGWTFLDVTWTVSPNLNAAYTVFVPNDPNLSASGTGGLFDMAGQIPMPVAAPGPNGTTVSSFHALAYVVSQYVPTF
ncbi:MAG: hypothetical protein NXI31_14960 [bacterium]|nr:hypothetical protein [bacterium]